MTEAPVAAGAPAALTPAERRRWWIAVLGLLGLALGLRLWHLGYHALWLDEAASLRRMRYPFGFMLRNIAENEAHPPAYYLILYAIGRPLQGLLSVEAAMRLPSLLAGLALVGAGALLERSLFPARRWPLATAMLTVSAFSVYFAQEARHYIFFGLWVALSSWCLLELLRRERFSWALGGGFILASTLALYTFYYSVFFLAAQGLALLACGRLRQVKPWRCAVLWGLPLLALLPYLPFAFRFKTRLAVHGADVGYRLTAPGVLIGALREILAGYAWPGDPLHAPGSVLLLLALVLCLALTAWRRPGDWRWRFLTCLIVLPVLCLLVFPWKPHQVESKHLFALLPFACLALSLPTLLDGPRRAAAPVLFGLFVLVNTVALARYYGPAGVKEDWRGAVAYIGSQAAPDHVFYPAPFFLEFPLATYAAQAELRCASISDFEIRRLADSDPAAAARLEQELQAAPVVWLVELTDSAVSGDDRLAKSRVLPARLSGSARRFPGRNGVIVVTPLYRRASSSAAPSP